MARLNCPEAQYDYDAKGKACMNQCIASRSIQLHAEAICIMHSYAGSRHMQAAGICRQQTYQAACTEGSRQHECIMQLDAETICVIQLFAMRRQVIDIQIYPIILSLW